MLQRIDLKMLFIVFRERLFFFIIIISLLHNYLHVQWNACNTFARVLAWICQYRGFLFRETGALWRLVKFLNPHIEKERKNRPWLKF